MPLRTLRFCPICKTSQHAAAREKCRPCGSLLLPMLDEAGALTREFLAARGTCCGNGCRNCPYGDQPAADCESAGVREKICGRCGGTFGCHSGGCWCDHVALSPDALQWLRRSFTDCLCPTCLAEFAVMRTED